MGIPQFNLRLIGPFGLTNRSGKAVHLGSRKSRALIGMLATGDHGRRSRVWLQDRLWGNAEPAKGQASLRREISNLRKSLSEQGAANILGVSSTELHIDLEQCRVDFLDALNGQFDRGILLGSEFLEGLDVPLEEGFEDWLRLCRGRLDSLREELEDASALSSSMVAQQPTTKGSFKTRLSIMPFSHWTNNPDGEALVDSLVQETSHVLSRYATLQVVDAGSPAHMRTKAEQAAFVERSRLRYFVTGNVRQHEHLLKITVGMTDCQTGLKVWSEKFDGEIAQFFDLPDQIAASLAPQIDGTIDRNEQRSALKAPVKHEDAYSLYWRANAVFRDWTKASILEAIALADRVVELEKHNAWASSLGGFCHALLALNQWADNPEETRENAKRKAFEAIEHEPNEPIVLGYAAGTLAILGDEIERADRLIKRALEMDQPTSGIYFWSAWIDLLCRRISDAKAKFETCLAINPNSSVRPFMLTGIAITQLTQSALEDAERNAEEALLLSPTQPIILATAGAVKLLLGKSQEARELALALSQANGIEAILPLMQNDAERQLLSTIIEQVGAGKSPDLSRLIT